MVIKKKLNLFNNYPLNHSLNKTAIKKFINLANPDVKNICKKIFDNTIHISFEKFLIMFNYSIKKFLNFYNSKRPIFILIDTVNYNNYKYKSNFWLYNYFSNFVNHKIIIIHNLNNKELKNDDTIIILDDCCYTGGQIIDTIEILNNKYNLNLTFYILVPYISFFAYFNMNLRFEQLNYNFIINDNLIDIPTCEDFLTTDEINLISKYYSNFVLFYGTYLIYFDHKLADDISTITLFYLGVIPNDNNKKILDKIKQSDTIINTNGLDIIPIINNCENIDDYINLKLPNCPYPPYKKDFFDFIKKIKKNKKIKSL